MTYHEVRRKKGGKLYIWRIFCRWGGKGPQRSPTLFIDCVCVIDERRLKMCLVYHFSTLMWSSLVKFKKTFTISLRVEDLHHRSCLRVRTFRQTGEQEWWGLIVCRILSRTYDLQFLFSVSIVEEKDGSGGWWVMEDRVRICV